MTIEINSIDDFENVVDSTESVVLRRRNSVQSIVIETAKKQSVVTQEAIPSGGMTRQTDSVWHILLPASETAPQPGDALVDSAGNRWTILKSRELATLGRWKCDTRELSISFGCEDRVDIERAVWDDLGSGPEIVGWVYVRTELPVHIQPMEMVVDTAAAPFEADLNHNIILSESIPLEPGDRFIAENGAIFLLQSYEQTDRIDVFANC